MNPSEFLERFLYLGETGTWSSFVLRNVFLFLGILAVWLAVVNGLPDTVQFSNRIFWGSFLVTLALAITINSALFFWSRFYGWKIRLSRKTNIVFAYNLEGTINVGRFRPKYEAFVKSVRNEIDALELGSSVNVVIAPSDVRFKEKSAAEAKTMLGLSGSTLLVWGYVTNQRRQTKFVTQFSYEFGYPRGISAERAREVFGHEIQKVLTSGLFSPTNTSTASFTEQITPTTTLILAMTTLSLGLLEPAMRFAKAFEALFKQETDLIRKKELGPASLKAEDIQVAVLRERLRRLSPDLDVHLDDIFALSNEILVILPNDYGANTHLAYVHEFRGLREEAVRHHNRAASNAPRGAFEHIFNSAYFALCAQRYEEALEIYDRIPNDVSTDVLQVGLSLNQKYSSTDELHFLFAEGYIGFRWGDKKLGRKCLRSFYRKASDAKYESLRAKASSLLS